MQRLDVKHHTTEEVEGYIAEGERILQAAGYTDEERIALLPTVLTLLSSKSVQLQVEQPIDLGRLGLNGK